MLAVPRCILSAVFKTVIVRTTFPSVKKGPSALTASVTKIQLEQFGFSHPNFFAGATVLRLTGLQRRTGKAALAGKLRLIPYSAKMACRGRKAFSTDAGGRFCLHTTWRLSAADPADMSPPFAHPNGV